MQLTRHIAPATPLLETGVREQIFLLRNDGVEGVIWNRDIPSQVTHALRQWNIEHAQPVRFCSKPSDVESHVRNILDDWRGLTTNARNWLVSDISDLAFTMAELLEASRLLVRVEPVRDDACRRFHKDVVKARLICTYKGPGTEYAFVRHDREQPTHSNRIATGMPVILRGKVWSQSSDHVLLHRSPPVEGDGITRFLVVMNEAHDTLPNGMIKL
ncbi:MAG: DUF1826 domain-containing protein [Maricaulis sp.]|uniref:DUF1826 domain-containing protein n=1 Tax=Maricaulis sp. TaxID=1486257 RepID=UPI001B10D5F8|nr:DUF1826 domain-containing protein [Maricaulis sp.]MBO6729828.1 DUF1826 domain-containing protein [Maricaulis sp.]MBO6848023.1 DUF1826 domain-containing protein [Maricaulis sp.]MBO6878074.1 DUF1826 domain-containing protein [Maricaulis sp.]